jgi:tetratricopeptide (TPR) repeat protein
MKQTKAGLFSLTIISLLVILLLPGTVRAEECKEWIAKIVSVQGSVQVKIRGQTQWSSVELHNTYCEGDIIRVREKSRAAIELANETVIRLDQKTTLTLIEAEKTKTSLIDLITGAVHFISRVPRTLEVNTPFVNGTVEGTEFLVRVHEDHTIIMVFEGKVRAVNDQGSLMLAGGQSAVASAGQAPSPHVMVRPGDAVQWALYYPPVIYYRADDYSDPAGSDWQTNVSSSIQSYLQGDLAGAFSRIEDVPEGVTDPRFFNYRASLLLAVGSIDEAVEDIEQTLKLVPGNSESTALQSVIAVVRNEKENALNLAQKAVSADPGSATARIALSYARQADFDLEGALASLKEAVRLDPQNSLAWARMAELRLSFRELDRALEAAQNAVALNPRIARTQTVLGYAYLTQIKTQKAVNAFEKAIQLDQADPLPRLGLGLARIRKGKLKEGRREIEIAASLDPNNSLIRSYMGKAYYEEKRNALAASQYDMAEKLDPLDPTPLLYGAIQKQTKNRPVEALHDMQKSIELNDNRAVYRSKLLLDSDEAARSASLARIYSDLGFQQRALVEGWQSVSTDPSNFSAHRFLADSYAVLPRHEIARVSELLQSQLLQPLNITPIQPLLGESSQFLISSGGPADLSFNEFNPLFNRNRLAFQASGLAGDNKTSGVEGIVTGIYNKFSFSGGYTHFETDGWRDNADQDDDIANVFVQMELSHKTSIQTEYRYRETEKGDLLLRFDPDNFSPYRRFKEETDSIRLGFHHAFSPGSHLIGNFMYSDSDLNVDDTIETSILSEPFPGFFVPATTQTISDVTTDNEAYGGELQYQFRSKYIDIVSGAGHFDIQSSIGIVTDVFLTLEPPFPTTPTPIPTSPEKRDTDVKHTDLYLYTYINFLENVIFTIGASGDFFDGGVSEVEDEDQFNPKFGVIWNPVPNTTLRGAVFRTLTRTLVDAQTVEPTQVAGFNQFFDEIRSTDAWRYGVAIDQKFSESIYGGTEFAMRDLEVPFPVGDVTFPNQRVDWEEYLGRAYFFWTPHKWLGLSAEYLYEKFDYDIEANLGAEDVKTHSFPFGVKFFHPSGLGASLKATSYDQEGVFKRVNTENFFHGEDNFWVVDAAISYRLPKRYGFITVGATNLFDEEFKYFDTDINNSRIQPERFFFVRATLAVP